MIPGKEQMRRTTWQILTTAALAGCSFAVQAQDQPFPAPVPEAAPVVDDAPAQATNPVNVPDLTGSWSGRWLSCGNGHNGPMNAEFCRRCDGHYDVKFNGRFFKLVPFRYKATLTVTGYADGKVYLSGSHNIGPLLGTFSYNAWSDGCQFVAGYCSRKDNGQFLMSRCCR
jgi:hypothetical protein